VRKRDAIQGGSPTTKIFVELFSVIFGAKDAKPRLECRGSGQVWNIEFRSCGGRVMNPHSRAKFNIPDLPPWDAPNQGGHALSEG